MTNQHFDFVQYLKLNGIEGVVKEFKFSNRKFRFDYAIPSIRLAIEIEGGIFTRQAHGSISGILRDIEKYNLASSLGWTILRFLPSDIYKQKTLELIQKTYALLTHKSFLSKEN